jgi:hypothetical protein
VATLQAERQDRVTLGVEVAKAVGYGQGL